MDLCTPIRKQLLKLKTLSEAEPRVETEYLFHGHEAGYCPRRIYLAHKNAKKAEDNKTPENAASLQMLFDDGYYHQESIVKVLKQCPNLHITNEEDQKYLVVYRDSLFQFIVSGHSDAVVTDTKTKKRYILEVKGLNHWSFAKLKNEDIETLKTSYPTAIPQARVYSRMEDTDGAIVLVKNKNTSAICQFFIERNEKAEVSILNKFQVVHDALMKDEELACTHVTGDPRTKYCPYPVGCGI